MADRHSTALHLLSDADSLLRASWRARLVTAYVTGDLTTRDRCLADARAHDAQFPDEPSLVDELIASDLGDMAVAA